MRNKILISNLVLLLFFSSAAMAQTQGGITAPNNQGIITQGQTGGTNILNLGPRKLKFSSELGDKLVSVIPKNGPISVTGVGSNSDFQVATQYADFLQQNGYKVTLNRIGVMAPPPEKWFTWNAATRDLLIAPSAN